MGRGKKQHSSSGDASIQLGFGEETVSDEVEKQWVSATRECWQS